MPQAGNLRWRATKPPRLRKAGCRCEGKGPCKGRVANGLHEEITIRKTKDENRPGGDCAGQARDAYGMSDCCCHLPASTEWRQQRYRTTATAVRSDYSYRRSARQGRHHQASIGQRMCSGHGKIRPEPHRGVAPLPLRLQVPSNLCQKPGEFLRLIP